MSTTTRALMPVILLARSVYFTVAAPPVCHNCDVGCNDTVPFNDNSVVDFDASPLNRTKRESTIEQRSCSRFQLEMVLIPLSIAMIPFGLCALLLCVCYCGPKESRGKVPEMFKKRAKIDAKDAHEIDDVELTCKDGVVMRKDSKKTRFSTAISFIEARRISIDIINNDFPMIHGGAPHAGELQEHEKHQPSEENSNIQTNIVKAVQDRFAPIEHKSSSEDDSTSESDRLPRRTSSKRTRFSDNVDILGEQRAS